MLLAALAQGIRQTNHEPNAVIAEPRDTHVVKCESHVSTFANPQTEEDIVCMVAFLARCRLKTHQEPTIAKTTDSTLESLMKGAEGLVVLNFRATWCFAYR